MNQFDLCFTTLRGPVSVATIALTLTVGVVGPTSASVVTSAVTSTAADNSITETSVPNGSVRVGNGPTDATCLRLPTSKKGFGGISQRNWSEWKDDVRFTTNNHFLQLPADNNSQPSLRHKFVPSDLGTHRGLMAADLPEARTYRLSQSLMFEPGFEWGGVSKQGGKIGFGLSGGTSPTGGVVDHSGSSARLMWRGNRDGSANMVIYSYASDRIWHSGEDYRIEGFDVPIGEWFNITMEITMNSTIYKSDGEARAWINGELVLVRNNIAWQTAGTTQPVIDNLYYSSFYGGDSREWSPSKTTYAQVRDVCWAAVINGKSGIDPENGQNNLADVAPNDPVVLSALNALSDNDYRSSVTNRIESISAELQSMIEEGGEYASQSIHGSLWHLDKARALGNWSSKTEINPLAPRLLNLDHAAESLVQAGETQKSVNRSSTLEESLANKTELMTLEVLDRFIGQLRENVSDPACAASSICVSAGRHLDKAARLRSMISSDGRSVYGRLQIAHNSWVAAAKGLNLLIGQ